MTNYVQSTNFATKDALPSGDPLKIVKGTEINTEFVNIATAVATKADSASPTLTSPTLVAPALGTPTSGNLANCTFPTLNQNTTGTAANVTGTVAVANGGTGANTLTGVVIGNGTSAFTTKTNPSGAFVGTTDTQTLTNKSIDASQLTGNVAAARITTALNASGSASIYACRAWVNFHGIPTAGTYGRTGTLVTIAMTGHGMTTGQVANLTFSAGTGGTATSGSYAVTVIDVDNYTITDSVSGTITGSPSVTRNTFIRASGNVSSITDNGVGDYTVNFATAMQDANYSIAGTARRDTVGNHTMMLAVSQTTGLTAASARIRAQLSGATQAEDSDLVTVVIFR